ncbi:MAG: PLP-dependent transferase [Ilumatobacteraceae bacterium]|nr:PLP-dependent transferase [Ilumatobacteraceae bacterium]
MAHDPDTSAITAGRDDSQSLATPLWAATVWASDGLDDTADRATSLRASAYYGRYANPTVSQFEKAIAELEGAESAMAFASGMGAIASVVLAFCNSGSHIVAQNTLYGGTLAFLEGPGRRLGIDVTYVDPSQSGAFSAAVQPGRTMLILAETPSNPRLSISNLVELGAIKGPFTVVDSTLATPITQRPLDYGVDLVLHSATKGIGGHNDAMLGVVAGEKDLIDALWLYGVLHGATASPYDALNGLRGIRTLPVRLRQQSSSALKIANALQEHQEVSCVMYPHLSSHPQYTLAKEQMSNGGSLIACEIRGGVEAVRQMFTRLEIINCATSFGGTETLVCHPLTSTHVGLPTEMLTAMGVTDGLIRLSIGLEHPDDIIAELTAALSPR